MSDRQRISRRGALLAAGGLAMGCGKAMKMEEVPADNGTCGEGLVAVPEADDLAVGQAMVVPGEDLLIARDERGFMALWQHCTHAGCLVAVNAAERTFDCPCHGSRFELDGQVRNGPAEEALPHFALCRKGGVLQVSRKTVLQGTTTRTR